MNRAQMHARVSQPGSDASSRTINDDDIDQAVADAQKGATTTTDETEDWLDSIDEALEEWAESDELAKAFVASYIQKGGE